jgi:UDP-N-acetylmuramate--L-alanine ligase/UDP-N-acetylenolpyruvoylglucosamine reductase
MKDRILQEISGGETRLRLHLLGVAGSGMSGLAGLLLQLGHEVSGSDRVSSDEIQRLQSLGLRFSSPHTAAAVAGCDAVIYSSAIKPGNVAWDAALLAKIPLVRRAEALAAITRRRDGIIVAGTHGKTTTSSLCALVLRVAGLHPGHYVGAEIPILGTNANWDEAGRHFVAEGDESDGTLVEFTPAHSIILNIEEEHLDHYKDWDAIADVFRKLCDQTSGHIVYCGDDDGARAVCGGYERAVSYGFGEDVDYRAIPAGMEASGSTFEVLARGNSLGEFTLGIAGRHNISNALAVIALATELGVAAAAIRAALADFRGARRRFETRYRSDHFHLVDDYGHHPTEIAATLAAARAQGRRRVLALFQPHRYSRTSKLRESFGACFGEADMVVVADVYAASESPIPGVDGGLVATSINEHSGRHKARFLPSLQACRLALGNQIRPGDLAITLGAGNVHECARPLARDLATLDALVAASGEPNLVARLYEPMRKHTTLLVGGPAQFWVEPSTFRGLEAIVRHGKENGLPLRVIGRGSNLLVRDGGISGVVIHPERGEFLAIGNLGGGRLRAGAGVKFKALAWAAREAGIGGFEWMEGIPGTVGGGLRMNAGAMGVQTFDQVLSVLVLREDGLAEVPATELGATYRHVPSLATSFALAATFQGRADTPVEEIDALLSASKTKRQTTQPVAASAGCFFKNASESPAGKLIDDLGLKGLRVGNAVVSNLHGNFLVNEGNASARDFLQLIEMIKRRARDERSIILETEVQIIGEEELHF